MLPFVERFDEHLLFSLERRYLDFIELTRLELATNPSLEAFDYRSHLRLFRLDEISHDGHERQGLHLLHMQNVLAAMKDDSHNLISIVRSRPEGTSLLYGLARRLGTPASVSTPEYGRILEAALQGNFLSAKLSSLSADQTWDHVLGPLSEYKHITAFPGVPSMRMRESDAPYVQGLDRFIEGMQGEDYCLLVVAEPIPLPDIDAMIANLFNLGTSVHAQVRRTIQSMRGTSDSVNVGMFNVSGESMTSTEGLSEGYGSTESETRLGSGGIMTSGGAALGAVVGGMVGSVVPGLGTAIGAVVGGGIGGLVGTASAWLSGAPLNKSASRASSFTRSVTSASSTMTNQGRTSGYTHGWNQSVSMGWEELNKTAEHCEKLTEAYVRRLQRGKNLGFWNVGLYLLTKDKYAQLRAEGLVRAWLSGDETHWEPIRSVSLDDEVAGQYLFNFSNPRYNLFLHGEEKKIVAQAATAGRKLNEYASLRNRSIDEILEEFVNAAPQERPRLLEAIRDIKSESDTEAVDLAWKQVKEAGLGHPLGPVLGGVSTPLNTEELSIIMNVPRREVQGVSIRSATAFGVNFAGPSEEDNIRLGRVIHKREPVEAMPYLLPCQLLQKHLFVCGVTGSGKTNTCTGLLRGLNLPFMVIEPAKTEYRQMLADVPNLKVFTLGGETISPFRINPFEFFPGSNLLTHVDNLKSVFNAAFPMYAAMPYILEEAIIGIYQDKGWELASSTNVYLHDSNGQGVEDSRFYDFLPTMQDLFEKIDEVVDAKRYAQEQTMNYSAALKARISSLLTGSKGLMLNTRRSTPMQTLLKERVVLELRHIGDDEEKCFLMGLLLSAIYEYREANGQPNVALTHVLLIEEAHRLLRRVPEYVSPEVGNTRGKAVETFSNVISEIRTLGQGLIVVDQIPSKLTPDVIKNTNTKIVHRTLAKDDREFVGATMNLTEEQGRELSLLGVGQAVIHREGMDKAFLVQIDRVRHDDHSHITDHALRKAMDSFHSANAFVFQRYPGFEKHPDIPATYSRTDFRTRDLDLYFAVMGGFVLMLVDETDALFALRRNVEDLIARRIRKDSEVEWACQVIHYATLIFSELNAKYPGCYDRCLAMNRIFADLWFDDLENLGVQERKRLTATLRQNMRYIRQDDRLTIPFFAFHLNRIDTETPRRIRESWRDTDQDIRNLDIYLRRVVSTLLSGTAIQETKICALAEDFLEMIFWTDPRRPTVLDLFRKYQGRR